MSTLPQKNISLNPSILPKSKKSQKYMSNVCPSSLNIEKHQIHKVFRTTAVAYQLSKLQLGTWWTIRYLIVFSGTIAAMASDFKQLTLQPPSSGFLTLPFICTWGFSLALNHWSWRSFQGEYFCTKKKHPPTSTKVRFPSCGSGSWRSGCDVQKLVFFFGGKFPRAGKEDTSKVMLPS